MKNKLSCNTLEYVKKKDNYSFNLAIILAIVIIMVVLVVFAKGVGLA
jgi:hypothetical protein